MGGDGSLHHPLQRSSEQRVFHWFSACPMPPYLISYSYHHHPLPPCTPSLTASTPSALPLTFATAEAYTVMTRKKVIIVSQPNTSDHVVPLEGPKQPGDESPPPMCSWGMRAA